MVRAVDVIGCIGHKTVSLRCHDFADRNRLIFKHPLLIQYLMAVKAPADFACQHFTFHRFPAAILVKIEAILFSHPRLGVQAAQCTTTSMGALFRMAHSPPVTSLSPHFYGLLVVRYSLRFSLDALCVQKCPSADGAQSCQGGFIHLFCDLAIHLRTPFR